MADPRNIAHDKKVHDEKEHKGEAAVPDAAETPQPGRKPTLKEDPVKGETYHQHSHREDGEEGEIPLG